MNTVITIIFFFLSSLILFAGLMTVLARNIIHAALWLIASFAGVAALYFLLEAPFIGVVQILVYAGAVSILMLFAIMLTRQITGTGARQQHRVVYPAVVAVGLLLLLVRTLSNPGLPAAPDGSTRWPQSDRLAVAATAVANTAATATAPDEVTGEVTVGEPVAPQLAGAREIGNSFMREYLLPFEIASILLLVALIGAIVIAYEERSRRRRVLTLAEEHALRRSLQPGGIVEPLHAIPGPSDQAGASTVGSSAGTTGSR